MKSYRRPAILAAPGMLGLLAQDLYLPAHAIQAQRPGIPELHDLEHALEGVQPAHAVTGDPRAHGPDCSSLARSRSWSW